MTIINCHQCGVPMTRKQGKHARCIGCYLFVGRVAGRAHGAVKRAIRDGLLANLKTSVVPCVDCGARASHYDHRDYTRPLTVEPVCHSCNLKRGPAARIPESAQHAEAA